MHLKKFACLLGLVVTINGVSNQSAFAILVANATMTATPNGGNYDYTITLHNTGSSGIETFWFAWLPGYDLLTSNPTVTGTPTNWTSLIEAGASGGYSIEWYDPALSSSLAGGQTSSAFKFTSPDSPAVLQGLDPVYHAYASTLSFVYVGAAEISQGTSFSIPITVVPEPSTLALLLMGGAGVCCWRAGRAKRVR